MKNQFVERKSAKDIDKQVEKILHGLGNPEPPLQLDHVRELLKLDRAYYTGTDHGAIKEFASKVFIGGKQILMRRGLILDVLKSWDLRAFYIPDQKRILLDSSQPKIKQRWNESHEIIHSVLDWHEATTFGDNQGTLTQACYQELEWEANYGAGQLLFLQNHFKERVADLTLELGKIRDLGGFFGNSGTTALWRVVEESRISCFGAIHPHPWQTPDDFDQQAPIRYLIQSRDFAKFFPHITEVEVFEIITKYCRNRRGGPLGEDTAILSDVNGKRYEFSFETFFNGYDALTLGVCMRQQSIVSPVTSNIFV